MRMHPARHCLVVFCLGSPAVIHRVHAIDWNMLASYLERPSHAHGHVEMTLVGCRRQAGTWMGGVDGGLMIVNVIWVHQTFETKVHARAVSPYILQFIVTRRIDGPDQIGRAHV